MEILMKLKCSPSVPPHGNNNTAHSTLKVVDHHHQLTQQHAPLAAAGTAPLVRLPSSQANINYSSSPSLPPILLQTVPRMPVTRPCLNYSKPPQCCNIAAAQQGAELFEPIWDQQGRRGLPYEISMQRTPNCCANITGINLFETPACCSGTCPPPPYGGTPPPPATHSIAAAPLPQPPPLQQAPPPLAYPTATSDTMLENSSNTDASTHYEYHEPEENFISIEDNKIKSLLMKIGRECALERKKEKRRTTENSTLSTGKTKEQQALFEIIDLDDEDDREELRQIRNQAEKANLKSAAAQTNIQRVNPSLAPLSTAGHENSRPRLKSPSISLIPKIPSTHKKNKGQTLKPSKADPSKERIIAHIELSDSSDSETEYVKAIDDTANQRSEVAVNVFNNSEDDEDDELSFAAAAVSCELECDDDENDDKANASEIGRSEANNSSSEIVILNSDDENVDFVEDKRLELRWEDLVRPEKGRQFFECYLCGKKVQSSYNLRRHMMIHTGERPFACDMCDRRFREFSDLKKHRRRHSNEPNFVCMVCRVKPPMMQDPTRCNDCDSKTIATTAATIRPQYSASPPSSPEKPQTPSTPTPPPQLPPLIAKPQLPTERIRDFAVTTTTATATITTLRNNSNTIITLKAVPHPPPDAASPKRPKSTTLLQSDIPSLVPINAPITISNKSGTQSLLDNIPAVHRPNYNQLGVMTRKEFPCPLCQRAFGTRHNLKRHFMIHTGEKPFSCSKCRKPFREYSTLKKHMVTHQRERYYKCLHCPSKYRDYLEYSEHKRTHVNEDDEVDDDEEINFDPQQLSSSSSTSSPQKRARTRYDSSYDSNEDDSSTEGCWLECCECKQRFTEIESYTRHLKEHDPSVYSYECYICKKTFEQRDELVEHVGACKEELRETALRRANCFK